MNKERERNFFELLKARWNKELFLCAGLDIDLKKLMGDKVPFPIHSELTSHSEINRFNIAIIDAVKDQVCCFKPNLAFYLKYGVDGLLALKDTILYVKEVCPEVPIILDAKQADIGNTNNGYAEADFDWLGADAVTVHPYLGGGSLDPFLERKNKGVIVLCRTSNPEAKEFQDLKVDGKPFYQIVAENVAKNWNKNSNCGVVVGATYPEELSIVRGIVGNMPILIPGVGKQGGDLSLAVKNGLNEEGDGIIINVSSSLIYASTGPDFADAARKEAIRLNELIKKYWQETMLSR